MLDEYLKQMDEKTRQVYEIAKEHLESSFNIKKSIGYKKWVEKKK